jgi:histidinol dehydrogenase
LQVIRYPNKNTWPQLISRPVLKSTQLSDVVAGILAGIKENGDSALKELTLKFDKVKIDNLLVTEAEINQVESEISDDLKKALDLARANIEKFHRSQLSVEEKIETMPGVVCWRRNVAIEKVGLYIPGGTAPLFSTVLMLAIPAKLAGCPQIILCTPPDKHGRVHPAILYAAKKTGVTSIFKAGGAQAIGAMAFGTDSIPKVDKIFGPGNQFVTEAKQQVNRLGVAIDMPAGPSEVLIVADETANPGFIAADLLSQAEHGPDSQVFCVTFTESIIEPLQKELEKQLAALPRKEFAAVALQNSKIVLLKSLEEAMDFSNTYAPEHLIIMVKELQKAEAKIINAGSVFLGNYTPEAAGDYASGTNHVLPTNSYARNYSGVSVDSFIKKITFQKITRDGLKKLGKSIELLAEAEELIAHKRAVSLRTGRESVE